MKLNIGFVGLGKMGSNMALNVIDSQWDSVGYDISEKTRNQAENSGIPTTNSLEKLIGQLSVPRVIFLSLPAGDVTDQTIEEVANYLSQGDIVIDSGNTNYKDTLDNYHKLKDQGIHLLDCGTSGGIEGARNGACLMIGGNQDVFKEVEPFFKDLAGENAYLYSGEAGSGHYLKMVHNGIEYGMMQAIGEGFNILEASKYDFDYEAVARLWNNESVIRSWLMELLADNFNNDAELSNIMSKIDSSGEAKYTVEEALELEIPVPIIANSLFVRNFSKIEDNFSNKVVSALRFSFGGHPIERKNP